MTLRNEKRTKEWLRIAAVFEAAKGSLVLASGFGLFLLVHKDVHAFIGTIVRHLHLNPARHYPHIFIDLFSHVTDPQLLALALSALLYAVIRLVEAYGLWHQRSWAEWFGFLSGGIYLPLEIYELARGISGIKLGVFVVNLLVVLLLGNVLYQAKRGK